VQSGKTGGKSPLIVATGSDEFEEPIGSPPSTPVLYNLIRNEGPPKFISQRVVQTDDIEEKDLVVMHGT